MGDVRKGEGGLLTTVGESSGRGEAVSNCVVVGGHYRLLRRIGKGSFGEIYEGVDTQTDLRVAVKVENGKKRNPHLLHESKLYKMLQGVTGVPKIFWYGTEFSNSILVMELLGPSTEDLFEQAGRQFSRKTALMIMYQYLCRMEGIHAAGVIHRDIKPHNFVTSLRHRYDADDEATQLIYVIDFGLSKRYCDSKQQHQAYKEGRSLTGTARYVSINTHYGVEPSRRDDLESCFYVMLYFLKGSLPWQGLRAANKKEKYLRIMERKVASSAAVLCADLPPALVDMLSRIRSMRYAEDPDYAYLKGTIAGLIVRAGTTLDFCYDWHLPPGEKNYVDDDNAALQENKPALLTKEFHAIEEQTAVPDSTPHPVAHPPLHCPPVQHQKPQPPSPSQPLSQPPSQPASPPPSQPRVLAQQPQHRLGKEIKLPAASVPNDNSPGPRTTATAPSQRNTACSPSASRQGSLASLEVNLPQTAMSAVATTAAVTPRASLSPIEDVPQKRGSRGLIRLTTSINGKGGLLFMRRNKGKSTCDYSPHVTLEKPAPPPQPPQPSLAPSKSGGSNKGAWSAAAVANYFGIRKKRSECS